MELKENENDLGTWTLNYLPPDGGRYTGKLCITDQRVLFDAKFDTSLTGIFEELFIFSGSHAYLSIDKSRITEPRIKKSLLSKNVIFEVDGKEHTFNYGILSVEKLFEAIKK